MAAMARVGASAGVFLLAGALALQASAATVTMWLEPNGDFGFDAASTNAALNAGIEQLPDSTFFSNSGATRISITTPSPISGTSVQNATVLRQLLERTFDYSPYMLTSLLWIGFVVPTQVSAVIFGGTESQWIVKKITIKAGGSLACLLVATAIFNLI